MRSDWTQASVGCHWTRGNYTISTFREYRGGGQFGTGGYVLVRHAGHEIGRFPTFEAAEAEADRLQALEG